jgi:type I restriction enzyme S subunit
MFSLGEVVRPNRPRVKPESMPDAPFIGMEHVEAHTMKLLGTVPASTMKSSAVHFKPGDVLYGRLRPYLNKVFRPTFEGLCSAEFIVFPENDRIDGRYLQYFLNSGTFVRFATHLNAGDRPRVDFDQIAPYQIPVPSLERQREIVAEIEKQFSRLDEAVANLQRVKANLKRYKASVLKAAVEGRLVETEAALARREGRTYETGEQLLQRILEERNVTAKGKRLAVNQAEHDGLSDCPDGWVWATCDAALKGIDAGASFKCEERPPLEGEIGVLKVSSLTWGSYDESESKTCKDESRVEEKYLVHDGDFLFSRANTIELVGACVIVGKTTKQLMLSDKTLRFDICPQVLPAWLLISLRCKFGRDEIERLATGNQESMRNIGQERIRQIRMPLPPQAEQARIVAEVDRHLSIIREVEAEVDTNLQRAQALRQATLAKAFLGEQK